MIVLFNQYIWDKSKVKELPINLLSIATYMNANGFDVRIFEAENNANVARIIIEMKPEIVGIGSQFTWFYPEVLSIAETIKKINPNIPVVIGGNHACCLNRLDNGIDYIVKGEGEVAFKDLCTKLLKGEKPPPIIGPYPLVKNLDEFPILDYSLVDIDKYLFEDDFFMRKKIMSITTTRGCPQDCIFCTVKGVWGRSWRGKSPERVIKEIKQLYYDYGIREIALLDDTSTIDKKRWDRILDLIIESRMDLRFTTLGGIAHWTLDKPIIKKMKQAGFYRFMFGIESGNTRIRKFIRKDFPLPYDLIKYANSIGIWTVLFFILGFPGETEEEMWETYNFSIKSGADMAIFYTLETYPSSDISKYKLDLTLAKKMRIKFQIKFAIHRILTSYKTITKIHSLEDFKFCVKLTYHFFKKVFIAFFRLSKKGLLNEL